MYINATFKRHCHLQEESYKRGVELFDRETLKFIKLIYLLLLKNLGLKFHVAITLRAAVILC